MSLTGLSGTHGGNEEVTNHLAGIPLRHAGSQGDLEHGVALGDLAQPVEDGPDLAWAQDAGLGLQQGALVLLEEKGG